MIAARRTQWNFALDRGITWARELRKPLVVFEALRVDYPWASDRLHRFLLDGMADNLASFERSPVTYFPYVEPAVGAARGLLATLARSACIVITDEFPCFFLPRMVRTAAQQVDVALETVDGNGLLPLAAADRAYTAANHFRRFVQRELTNHVTTLPAARPLTRLDLPRLIQIPDAVARRWRPASRDMLEDPSALSPLPIDHQVPTVATRGGERAGQRQLHQFVRRRLIRYGDRRNHPDSDITSRLSPYLHFGHVSAHQIFSEVMRHERWSPQRVRSKRASGAREGWWGVSASAETFLDQLVVWRELAYNTCARRPDDYHHYESLPDWAKKTLSSHRRDPRPHRYTVDRFEAGETHDRLWNAIQTQLRREGWFHNYLRMLWGKKILEWSPAPRDALSTMIHVMNRWSLDGRNPNSYAGYFWTLGRYDRPWPEREVFGKVRSMSSERTRQKVDVEAYLVEYASTR